MADVPIGDLVKFHRRALGLGQVALATRAGISVDHVSAIEQRVRTPSVDVLVKLARVLNVPASALLGEPCHGPDVCPKEPAPCVLASLELDPDDMPEPADIEVAVLRLRRSYSTTPPEELHRRLEVRLRQVRRLLAGLGRAPQRRALLEAAAWLALLRGTVQADLREYEAAETSVRVARELAREIGHKEVEAWTWETAAWMAATDGRQRHARDLAGVGVEVAPPGGYALVAATMQRARINGALGDRTAAIHDLLEGQRALSAAGEPEWPDDHYAVDPAKGAFFASGTFAQLRMAAETAEQAAEVVRTSEDPLTRNYWPMRVANARIEWAMALCELGNEDAAAAMAASALDARWMRPDTERRMHLLLSRMRDRRLHADLVGKLDEAAALRERALKTFQICESR